MHNNKITEFKSSLKEKKERRDINQNINIFLDKKYKKNHEFLKKIRKKWKGQALVGLASQSSSFGPYS